MSMYPLPSVLPLDVNTMKDTFSKAAIVDEDNTVTFKTHGETFHLTSECFPSKGFEVMIDAGFNVFQGGVKIGKATRCA